MILLAVFLFFICFAGTVDVAGNGSIPESYDSVRDKRYEMYPQYT